MDLKAIKAIRRRNLRLLISTVGEKNQRVLGDKLGIDPSLVSQIVNETRGMGEILARKIERRLGLQRNTLDYPMQAKASKTGYEFKRADGHEPDSASATAVRDGEQLYAAGDPAFAEARKVFARYAALTAAERIVADLLLGLREINTAPIGVQGALDLAVELCAQTGKTGNPQAPGAAARVG